MRELTLKLVNWPARGTFRISHGALTEFETVQIQISEKNKIGWAECRPYARYGETAQSVISQIRNIETEIVNGLDIENLQFALPAGAARNLIDCALWDLEAKRTKQSIWSLTGQDCSSPVQTAFTLSIDRIDRMVDQALKAQNFSLLKVKINGVNGLKACEAVLRARPDARLIIDANEALKSNELEHLYKIEAKDRIALIEQPLKSGEDFKTGLNPDAGLVFCADESIHNSEDLKKVWDAGYRAVNIKLDKTGGLTEAIRTFDLAEQMNFKIMAGCMVGSSLALAPMTVLMGRADFVDLDGPLLLSKDVPNPIHYENGYVYPTYEALWG